MTPPLTRPLTPSFWFVTLACLLFAVVMPFARRDDWLGWLSFGTITVLNFGLWGLLIGGLIRALRARKNADAPPNNE